MKLLFNTSNHLYTERPLYTNAAIIGESNTQCLPFKEIKTIEDAVATLDAHGFEVHTVKDGFDILVMQQLKKDPDNKPYLTSGASRIIESYTYVEPTTRLVVMLDENKPTKPEYFISNSISNIQILKQIKQAHQYYDHAVTHNKPKNDIHVDTTLSLIHQNNEFWDTFGLRRMSHDQPYTVSSFITPFTHVIKAPVAELV